MSATGSGRMAGRESGMTLLELLVAMAIMTLISALAFPELDRMRDAIQLRRTVLLLASDLRRARAAAIGTGAVTAVTVASHSHSYDVIGIWRNAPDGIRFTGAGMRFYADGTTSGGALAVTGRTRRIAVFVDPVNGGIAMDGLR